MHDEKRVVTLNDYEQRLKYSVTTSPFAFTNKQQR